MLSPIRMKWVDETNVLAPIRMKWVHTNVLSPIRMKWVDTSVLSPIRMKWVDETNVLSPIRMKWVDTNVLAPIRMKWVDETNVLAPIRIGVRRDALFVCEWGKWTVSGGWEGGGVRGACVYTGERVGVEGGGCGEGVGGGRRGGVCIQKIEVRA